MNENNEEVKQETSETVTPAVTSASVQSFAIPAAIIVGFGLIAGAIYFSGNQVQEPAPAPVVENRGTGTQLVDNGSTPGTVNPITENDHIVGNPNAPIMLVEYSDYDCPFCKVFHESLSQIMNEYGANGNVAWTYRHFPIPQLHPNATHIAEASECVASLGGNEAFWTFSNLVFGEREVNSLTDITQFDRYAKTSGVDITAFNSCLENHDQLEAVNEDIENGISLGINGTPHTILLIGDQQFPIKGAQPYENVKGIIEQLLAQIEDGTGEPPVEQ